MMADEQISLDTKIGQVRASGLLTPVIILSLALIGGVVWYGHTEAEAVRGLITQHNTTQQEALGKISEQLDTLIAIQCATLRSTKSQVQIPKCY